MKLFNPLEQQGLILSNNKTPSGLKRITKNKTGSVYFIGIGGIGISALAKWFLAKKWVISGSDLAESVITKELAKRGVKIKIGHKKANIPRPCDLIIYSQAVKPDNPEFMEARRRKIKLFSYPQAVGLLTLKYKTIAVAGAHGKSTTTALIGFILARAGFDPTVIVGTKVFDFGKKLDSGENFRSGKSEYLVLEADEWRASFLHYSPAFLVLTNIDAEHLDFYKNLLNVKKTFLKLISRVKKGGVLILNRDDKNIFSLKKEIIEIVKKNNLKIFWFSLAQKNIAEKIKKEIKIPGEHNLADALAAFTLTKVLKIPEKKILETIGAYRGSWRRMQSRGNLKFENCKLKIFDDYAHHPTEIKATLKAFREKFPKQKLICVFQPHQAERLASLFPEFQTAFKEADITLVLPIYEVAGRDKINLKFTSEKLVQAIQKKHPKKLVFYLENPKNIKKALKSLLKNKNIHANQRESTVLIMMGAGDIVNYTPFLLR